MELTERYLQSLKQLLPADQREDIIRELSENLHSEIEDQERELGRSLTEAEVRSLLQQHGTPMAAAERYVQGERSFSFGRQIIGPVLFPFYLRVLAFTAGIQGVVVLMLAALLGFNIFPNFILHLALQFAIVTGIFALIQTNAGKIPDLNPVLTPPSYPPAPRASRVESAAEILALVVVLGLLKGISASPAFHLGPDVYTFGDSWLYFYNVVFLVGLIRISLAAVNLFCPEWVRFPAFFRVCCGFLWLIVIGFSLRTGRWIVPEFDTSTPGAESVALVDFANQLLFMALISATAITTALTVIELIRLLRGYYSPRPAAVATG